VTGFNVSSPLSWAGPFQGLFIVIGIAYAALWLRPGPSKARTALAVIGLPLAVVVGGYHGWLLTIVKARPLWNTGPATIAALLGFATTGIAAVLLVLCFMPKRKGANGLSEVRVIRNMRDLLLAGLILQGLTFFVWWVSLYFGSAYDREALAGANAATGPLFWSVGIGVGLVIPAVLEIGDLVLGREGTRPVNVQLTAFGAVLILVGGLAFRYSVLIGGLLS
jgi:formate-dependent nitrite reductase membrane component NrfD